MDSQPDPRVSFNPDAWQRRVLDCLDDVDDNQNLNHSVLVVGESLVDFLYAFLTNDLSSN